MKQRLLLADGQNSVREMLRLILAGKDEYEVVGEADSGTEAMRQCRHCEPFALITELNLPHTSGLEVVRILRAEQPRLRILIYTGTASPALVQAALKLRPHGFVHKSDPFTNLLTALREVCAGNSYFTALATRVADHATPECLGLDSLCERERSVLQKIAEGETNRGIAASISVSPKTVEHYRHSLMQKLKLHSVAALTRFAVQQGLVSLD